MTERLLIFSPNWLGDAVMALPAISDIMRGLPGAAIDVAARKTLAPLFSMVPGVRRIITLESGSAGVRQVREGRYDAAILLPNSFAVARLAYSAGIQERWGYRADFRSLLLTRAFAQPGRVHQTESYRTLVRALGFPGDGRAPHLEVPDERRVAGRALLADAGWDTRSPLVALAPGAAFGGAKRWPASSFAALADRLSADGIRTVVVGGPGDRPAAEALLAAVGKNTRPIDTVGRTDLPMLAAVLVHCQALVSNDSGAMHVAAALGLNIAALFGPTKERETGPVGSGRHTLAHQPGVVPSLRVA